MEHKLNEKYKNNKFYDDEAEKLFKNFRDQPTKKKKRKELNNKNKNPFDIINPSYE